MEEAKKQCVDIILFPEMTLTGFSMNTKKLSERLKILKQ